MLKNYLRIAWRNLIKNKIQSFINIAGLSIGMMLSMLIGLWIWDELSFNEYHQNYDRIAQVMLNKSSNGEIRTQPYIPFPLGAELHNNFGSDFKNIMLSSGTENHILSFGEKNFTRTGNYLDPQAPEMLTLKMLRGVRSGLSDPSSILLSESVARTYFGNDNPIGKIMKIDNGHDVKVTGVYKDLPYNSQFKDLLFIAPLDLFVSFNPDLRSKEGKEDWGNNFLEIFVQLNEHADMEKVSAKIRNIISEKTDKEYARIYKPEIFLHPMSKWHLYSEFKNGMSVGGSIEFVWLFGIIGIFVLLLACINFMNLSTARSEKRAKEVGIRKAIGSLRVQLIYQFFGESLLVVAFSFMISLFLVQLTLPFFNEISDKRMSILWSNPLFWISGIGCTIITGLIAGSYPALYLSSFIPVKVLKGHFRAGRFAAIPRKILVVIQFTVSVTLIIGTIVVFRQIQFAKNRPIGYHREGLIMIGTNTRDIHNHFDIVRDELKKSGAMIEMAESGSPITELWSTTSDLDWRGKNSNMTANFRKTGVTYEYGKTVGWQFKEGRDFSSAFSTDSSGMILNESAVKFMDLKKPVGEIITWAGKQFKIIGVIRDMVTESPYAEIRPSIFYTAKHREGFVYIRINPTISFREALRKIESVFKKYAPASPFDYKFVDEEYAKKFGNEERISKLAGSFTMLAIFISCLGLFGMASFVAEQRIKEIGVRKVLGASVFNLWRLLTKDFLALIIISLLIAMPTAYYFMNNWLQNYQYRSEIPWWIFAAAGLGTIIITLLTVSSQAISTAMANPVKSLKTE